MKIAPDKIAAYINFLYQRKYNSQAPAELLDKWNSVPYNLIGIQLTNLYAHWNMDAQEIDRLETEFNAMYASPDNGNLQPSSYTPPPPVSGPHPTSASNTFYPQATANNSRGPWKTIVFVLLGLIGLGVAYYFYQQNSNSGEAPKNNDGTILKSDPNEKQDVVIKADTVKTDTIKPTKTVDTVQAAKADNPQDVAEETAERTRSIEQLLRAETDRNVNGILDKFAASPLQYWEMKNPTELQLRDVYMKTWSKADDIKYKNVNVKRVSKNTYDLYADYSYFSVKDGNYKSMSVQTRYVFNDAGKIIRTYGVNVNGR